MSADKPTRGSKSQSRSDFWRLNRRFMSGLLRSLFFINRSTRHSRAGFVLPTTVLLLLVMTLTVGALSFRSFSRTQSTSIAREQQMIDNVAAPALDRAKAKLEYLFTRDTRLPGVGTPSSDVIAALMLNVNSTGVGGLGITKLDKDPYTLPDEKRLNINGTTLNAGAVDNAWSFGFDLNGDGAIKTGETIAYSILMDDAVEAGKPNDRSDDIKLEDTGAANNVLKANNLVTRNGPINTAGSLVNCGGSREPQQGWLAVTTATLEKNFQITAFASNGKDMGRANSALELQQVRRALQGNRWGAWFKYDLEVSPNPEFNWTGAMHTDGSMMISNNVKAHMISSHNSCLYSEGGSAITMAQNDNDGVQGINVNNGDFQGQLIAGVPVVGNMGSSNTPRLHIFTTLGAKPKVDQNETKLTKSSDSVEGDSYDDLLKIAIDPVELFTKNVSKHRGTGWQRATNWANSSFANGRVVNNPAVAPPYLDDFYRADNRYGPRPSYDKTNWVTRTDDGTINTTRSSPNYDAKLGDEILLTDESGDNLINTAAGLDGYWERQAIGRGMRVVVGQRLELGNPLGWNFNAGGGSKDPLYPPGLNNMANKQKQRVTLRDNLAAVQGMVVYQYESNNGNFPLACIANTAHPGTIETLRASRTFANNARTGTLKTSFLTGEGTNGWEFSFPSSFDTEAKFGAELADSKPLGIALRNLAYFAGDPRGGTPSFAPIQNAFVHPFPQQAMWGDYSTLRRIFTDELDNSTNWRSSSNPPSLTTMSSRYDALSPADKSSLHSAACTLGMLAYNLSSQQASDRAVLLNAIPNQGAANGIGAALIDAIGARNSGPTGSAATGCTAVTGLPYDYDCRNISIDKEAVIAATGISTTRQTAVKLVGSLEQIKRDRLYGFRAPSNTTLIDYVGKRGSKQYLFRFPAECDPDDPNSLVAELFEGVGNGLTDSKAAFALMCAPAAPKYPSLYYLFPKANHSQVGSGLYAQPSTEEYINQPYLTNSTNGVNRSVTYKVVGDDGSTPAVEDSTDTGISAISFEPRLQNQNLTNWALPRSPRADGTLNPESMTIRYQILGSPNYRLADLSLLEKVTYNGREEMAVRVLDIDLGRLTKTRTGGSTGDYWISDGQDTTSGIFYAAREDALREDAVVRPASAVAGAATIWSDCNTLTKLLGSNRCWMNPSSSSGPTDPPLSLRNDGSPVGISLKPVDFAPDPDRRPHGFRLNANLNGNKGDLSDQNKRNWGFTFVTDNAAYLKGTFNPHTSNGDNTLEEFKQTLFDENVGFGNDFYDKRIDLNTSIFAARSSDRWRVAEILADAVYVLSNNFVDGAVQEGFIRDRTQVSPDFNNSKTSFHNQQRPLANNGSTLGGASGWLRMDGSSTNTAVPIWVGNNGESKLSNGTLLNDATAGTNFELPDERKEEALIDADTPDRMNATIISGIIPSRDKQSYGGLHNFPRFLEHWGDRNLFMQGAFLQLNFSTAGTGPWDADAWQPEDVTNANQRILYYKPPARRWGYDVGLQYAPAGPIAQRFVQVDRPRSENYRELSVDDPYVTNLRCSKKADGNRPFPEEVCP